MKLPHAMQMPGTDRVETNAARYLTFDSFGDFEVSVSVGIVGALYRRDELTKFLRRVLMVLEAGERPQDDRIGSFCVKCGVRNG